MNYCQNMYNSLERKDKIEELEEENANLKDFHNIESERLNKNIMLLKEENTRLRLLVEKLQSFFGFEREILYRDLDGEMYPLDLSEIKKTLEKSE